MTPIAHSLILLPPKRAEETSATPKLLPRKETSGRSPWFPSSVLCHVAGANCCQESDQLCLPTALKATEVPRHAPAPCTPFYCLAPLSAVVTKVFVPASRSFFLSASGLHSGSALRHLG